MNDLDLTTAARAARDAVYDCIGATLAARVDQHHAPPQPLTRRHRDELLRPSGGISRPTEDVALDERRLALKAAVQNALEALEVCTILARDAEAEVRTAHALWRGETGEDTPSCPTTTPDAPPPAGSTTRSSSR